MECSTAESMVNRYIDRSLKEEELEEFLEHVTSCSSCYDELETYFIVHEAIQQLDDEGESMMDLQHLLEQDLKKSRRICLTWKITRWLVLTAAVILILILAGGFAFLIWNIWR